MIESARALCGGLLLFVFWFSIFSVSVPALAAANSDAAATKAHTHHRHGVKPKVPKSNEEPGLVQGFVMRATDWAIKPIKHAITVAKNELVEFTREMTLPTLVLIFLVLVVSAFIGTSLAIGSFVRKFYKIVERLNPANKPVVLVLDENQMKVINPHPTQPVLESPSDKIGQLAKKEPVTIDIKPRPKRRQQAA